MAQLIQVKDVWKIYPMGDVKVAALKGLNVSIKKSEFVAILGPSGSGKSTAMAMVGCLDLPSEGKVLLEGKDISSLAESDLAQIRGRKIGFVFQSFNLIPSLTLLENVGLPLVFQGKSAAFRLKRAKELLESVGLGHRLTHRPNQISGGERQRVAIARALVNDPEIVLADEPTGNLDTKTGELIMTLFKDLHKKKKKTIIMVTHDGYVAKKADRVIKLKDGVAV